MKIIAIIMLILNVSIFSKQKDEMRTTWVATVKNLHFPKIENGRIRNNIEELKVDWIEILKKHEELNFNTVIFQVSPTLDAFYKSKNRPWSEFLTGKQGVPPEWAEEFDLLDWMIEETHKRGMEFHAWFNPYRVSYQYYSNATYKDEIAKLSSDNFAIKNEDLVYMFDKKLYLDPGDPRTIKHIEDTIEEFIEKYDVDAVHFDDYFYPYKVTRNGIERYFGDEFEDRDTFRENPRGFEFIEDISTPEKRDKYQDNVILWRINNNTLMVKAVKDVIDKFNKKNDKAIQWGISPFGIWAHKAIHPDGSDTPKASTSSVKDIYANTRKWVIDESIDYIIPQIYWSFNQPAAPYGVLAEWWNNVAEGVRTHLYIGHGNYKHLNASKSKDWANINEIPNQLEFNKNLKNIKGSAFFGYRNVIKNPGNGIGVKTQNNHIDLLKKTHFNKKVLVPAKPWLDKKETKLIEEVKITKQKDKTILEFNDELKNDTRFYVFYSNDDIIKVVGRDKENVEQKIEIKNSELKGKDITSFTIKDLAGVETPKMNISSTK